VQILEDRELEFVYPMLKIESLIFEKIQSNLSANELNEWIEKTVSPDIRNSNDFIQSLVTW
jgi:translation initiation factor 4G